MLQKVGKRRKSRGMLWIRIRRFLRKMAKKAKVRRMRSEEGFIGRGGEKSEVAVSSPNLELAPGPSDGNLSLAI